MQFSAGQGGCHLKKLENLLLRWFTQLLVKKSFNSSPCGSFHRAVHTTWELASSSSNDPKELEREKTPGEKTPLCVCECVWKVAFYPFCYLLFFTTESPSPGHTQRDRTASLPKGRDIKWFQGLFLKSYLCTLFFPKTQQIKNVLQLYFTPIFYDVACLLWDRYSTLYCILMSLMEAKKLCASSRPRRMSKKAMLLKLYC